MSNKTLALILAAGKGSRLDADCPKPLYPIDNKPIIMHIIDEFKKLNNTDICIVVGHQKEKIMSLMGDDYLYAIQNNQLGTADAVRSASSIIEKYENTFVFVGDAPFIDFKIINDLYMSHLALSVDCSFLYSDFPFDLPYARLVQSSSGDLMKCIEYVNANEREKKLSSFFTSHYLFKSKKLLKFISDIQENNNGEYYLTDIINIFLKKSLTLNPLFIKEFWKLMGINTQSDVTQIKKYFE